MVIPFNIPTFIGEEIEFVLESLKSMKHCGNNNFSRKCRDLLIDKYGFLDVFLTTSCTTAMEMGVLLCDIKPGDEVILPSYTFSSTANSFVLRGGIPVFCEIEKKSMNINHNKIHLYSPSDKEDILESKIILDIFIELHIFLKISCLYEYNIHKQKY